MTELGNTSVRPRHEKGVPVPARPSIPFPETQERRAALSRDITAATGLDEAVLERLVRAFYAAAREDPLLARIIHHALGVYISPLSGSPAGCGGAGGQAGAS
ncbi:hypothetical protein C8P66_14127, partial [Humitalea rosea]